MNWYKIRRAKPQDKAALHRIERACFALPWSADELIKDATENILAVYYVAEAAGSPGAVSARSGDTPGSTSPGAVSARPGDTPGSTSPGAVSARPDPLLVGYAGLWVVLDEGHITNVAVDPDYRRQGIAAMLLLKLLEAAREKGAKRFTLEVKRSNAAAIALYERFGFRAAGSRKGYYEEDGEDAVIMWTDT
ncbi:MAG: ribosomal protein S18-alanine N-acetyltransferase [Clostridiales Family XIII bacterium]|jgi:ribosomal-protein-alanine N-acetyltransferase|nr:ribosomal protein S18-alanine N-acetyltransferase [Clostridiales Family XIII bacterium]